MFKKIPVQLLATIKLVEQTLQWLYKKQYRFHKISFKSSINFKKIPVKDGKSHFQSLCITPHAKCSIF